MSDLSTLNTAYPDVHPWIDLRGFLVNGWTSLGTQTCGVSAHPNLLFWSMRLIADDSTSVVFIDGLPENLRPPQNLPVAIFTPAGSSFCLVQRSTGRLYLDQNGLAVIPDWDRTGQMTVTGVTPRGTAV